MEFLLNSQFLYRNQASFNIYYDVTYWPSYQNVQLKNIYIIYSDLKKCNDIPLLNNTFKLY